MFPQKTLTFHSLENIYENASVKLRFGLHDPDSTVISQISIPNPNIIL